MRSDDELMALTGVIRALTRVPGALAYVNPSGETLLLPANLDETVAFAGQHGRLPLEVWTNVRMMKLTGLADGWMLMDTVGLGQLDLPDHEAVFHEGDFDPNEVARFLRNVSLYVTGAGDVIQEGHTLDGKGGMNWRAQRFEDGVSGPPRPTVRLFPTRGSAIPGQLRSPMAQG
ncbi:MAG TPA: DUF4261 domain-containing protein [Polyangia bacterium]